MKLRWLLVAFVVLVATACQADATVDVSVNDDGSGLVTFSVDLDAAIVDAAPEVLDGLRTDDLGRAGWTVEGPTSTDSGGAAVSVSKPFDNPDHLAGVLDEIAGSTGIFRDFTVTRERSFARTTYTLEGRVNQGFSIETLSDEQIIGLVGSPLGRDIAELEALAGRPLNETVSLTFTVTLPDSIEANVTSVEGRTASWFVTPTDPLPTEIFISSSVEDRVPRLWAAVALVAIALLATLVVFRLLARLGGRPDHDDDAVQLRRPDRLRDDALDEAAQKPRPPKLELVVLDARGVLYDEANDIGARLVPFVRERGSRSSLQEINDAFRNASLGRLSTSELWSSLQVDGDPLELDTEYTGEFRLREGVLEFIDRLHERGLRVAVITNNVVGWSKMIRRRFDLDERVDTWVVSGEVGARKPDAAFFEALRRITHVPYTDALLIDDQLDDLDMARSLGMSTAMFVPADAMLPAQSSHPIVHGFDSFFGRR